MYFLTDILSFLQTPAGILAADTRVTFSCQAIVNNVTWIVRLSDSTSTRSPEVDITTRLNDSNTTLSTLSTLAKGNENNTQVTCIATGSNSSDNDSRTSYIVVAGRLVFNTQV